MDPATSATRPQGSYPPATKDNRFESLYQDLRNFAAVKSQSLAPIVNRAFDIKEGSEVLRKMFEQDTRSLQAVLPSQATAKPIELISLLAGDNPEARSLWIGYCAHRGILKQEEAKELFPKPPLNSFEERVQKMVALALNDPEEFRKTMEHEIDLALADQKGILGSETVRENLKKNLPL